MNGRGIVSKSPNIIVAVVVCGTLLSIGVLVALVVLTAMDKDAAEISRFVNTVLNFVTIIISSGGALAAGAALRTSQEAKQASEEVGQKVAEAADNAK